MVLILSIQRINSIIHSVHMDEEQKLTHLQKEGEESPHFVFEFFQYLRENPFVEQEHPLVVEGMRNRFHIPSELPVADVRVQQTASRVVGQSGPVHSYLEEVKNCGMDTEKVGSLIRKIEESGKLNEPDSFGITLLQAALQVNIPLALVLLKPGVVKNIDVNLRDASGMSPLIYVLKAIRYSGSENRDKDVLLLSKVLNQLMEREDVDFHETYEGMTACHHLFRIAERDVFTRLKFENLEKYYALNIVLRVMKSPNLSKEEKAQWLSKKDPERGVGVLADAAAHGLFEFVEVMKKAGFIFDPAALDSRGNNGLHLVLESRWLSREKAVNDLKMQDVMIDMVEMQSSKSADEYHNWLNHQDATGRTPLMAAANFGMRGALNLLVKQGADLGIKDHDGRTPLHYAVLGSNRKCVSRLLELGCDPNQRDRFGLSPIEYLMLSDEYESVTALAESGGKVLEGLRTTVGTLDLQDKKKREMVKRIRSVMSRKVPKLLRRSTISREDWEVIVTNHVLEDKLMKSLESGLMREIGGRTRARANKLSKWLMDSRRQDEFKQRMISNPTKYQELQSFRMKGSDSINCSEAAGDKWKEADAMVTRWAKLKKAITLEDICEINSVLNLKGEGGVLREHDVYAGQNSQMIYALNHYVKPAVDQNLKWLQASIDACEKGEKSPIEVAALAYYRFVSIHPFDDGNGRTSRMIMNLILMRFGLPKVGFGNNVADATYALRPFESITPNEMVRKLINQIVRTCEQFGMRIPANVLSVTETEAEEVVK